MENERNIDKLAGWMMKLAVFAVILAACWYFRSVLVYVLVASTSSRWREFSPWKSFVIPS